MRQNLGRVLVLRPVGVAALPVLAPKGPRAFAVAHGHCAGPDQPVDLLRLYLFLPCPFLAASGQSVHSVARLTSCVSKPNLLPQLQTRPGGLVNAYLVHKRAMRRTQVQHVCVTFRRVVRDGGVLPRAELAFELDVGVAASPEHNRRPAVQLDRFGPLHTGRGGNERGCGDRWPCHRHTARADECARWAETRARRRESANACAAHGRYQHAHWFRAEPRNRQGGAARTHCRAERLPMMVAFLGDFAAGCFPAEMRLNSWPPTWSRREEMAQRPGRVGSTGFLGLHLNARLEVVSLVPHGPSARCGGIRTGDILLAVNGESVQGRRPSEVTPLLTGSEGASTELSLLCKESCGPKLVRLVLGTAGLGMALVHTDDCQLRVEQLEADGAAQAGGVLIGDLVEYVDGVNVKGKPVKEVTSLVSGAEGTKCKLVVRRQGDSIVSRVLTFTLTRGFSRDRQREREQDAVHVELEHQHRACHSGTKGELRSVMPSGMQHPDPKTDSLTKQQRQNRASAHGLEALSHLFGALPLPGDRREASCIEGKGEADRDSEVCTPSSGIAGSTGTEHFHTVKVLRMMSNSTEENQTPFSRISLENFEKGRSAVKERDLEITRLKREIADVHTREIESQNNQRDAEIKQLGAAVAELQQRELAREERRNSDLDLSQEVQGLQKTIRILQQEQGVREERVNAEVATQRGLAAELQDLKKLFVQSQQQESERERQFMSERTSALDWMLELQDVKKGIQALEQRESERDENVKAERARDQKEEQNERRKLKELRQAVLALQQREIDREAMGSANGGGNPSRNGTILAKDMGRELDAQDSTFLVELEELKKKVEQIHARQSDRESEKASLAGIQKLEDMFVARDKLLEERLQRLEAETQHLAASNRALESMYDAKVNTEEQLLAQLAAMHEQIAMLQEKDKIARDEKALQDTVQTKREEDGAERLKEQEIHMKQEMEQILQRARLEAEKVLQRAQASADEITKEAVAKAEIQARQGWAIEARQQSESDATHDERKRNLMATEETARRKSSGFSSAAAEGGAKKAAEAGGIVKEGSEETMESMGDMLDRPSGNEKPEKDRKGGGREDETTNDLGSRVQGFNITSEGWPSDAFAPFESQDLTPRIAAGTAADSGVDTRLSQKGAYPVFSSSTKHLTPHKRMGIAWQHDKEKRDGEERLKQLELASQSVFSVLSLKVRVLSHKLCHVSSARRKCHVTSTQPLNTGDLFAEEPTDHTRGPAWKAGTPPQAPRGAHAQALRCAK